MAFPKETPWPVVSTKRRLDNADDCQLDVDEFKKPKTVVPVMRKYPPPKIRTGVHFIRDLPPGCGTLHDSLQVERKPLKKLANIDDSNIANNDKTVNSQSSVYTKPKAFGFKKPSSTSNHSSKVKFWDPMQQIVHDFPPVSAITEDKKPSKNQHNINSNLKKTNSIENNRPSYASKPPAKVKFNDPTTDVQISKDANTVDSRKRNKILEVMILFESIYTQLYNENKSKQKGEKIAHWRVPTEAANITKQKLKYLPPTKSLGQIRGVHPGDKFKFRSQLQLTGLHSQPHCGIDYTEINGKKLAISIVDSHRYSNGTGKSCDVISYCGEGGGGGGAMFGFGGSQNRHVADDQKLERGNLALKNSMIEKSPVRVMRKVFGVGNGKEKNDLFVYDGLYIVKKCVQKRGAEGKMVFVFQLHKIDGQNPKKVNGNGFLQRYSTFQMVFDEVCV